MQTVESAISRIPFRLGKMVYGAAGIVRSFGVYRGCRILITEIEKKCCLRGKPGYLHPDQRQLIRAIPFFDMKFQFSLVISGNQAQIATVIIRREKSKFPVCKRMSTGASATSPAALVSVTFLRAVHPSFHQA